MVNGRPGPSVHNRAMVAVNSVHAHTIVAWPMMLKRLCVVQVVLIQPGRRGPPVHCATISVSHQFWPSDNAVKHVRMSKTCKRRHAWHHDVRTGPSGAVGVHAQSHAVMVLELDHEHVLAQPSSVPR